MVVRKFDEFDAGPDGDHCPTPFAAVVGVDNRRAIRHMNDLVGRDWGRVYVLVRSHGSGWSVLEEGCVFVDAHEEIAFLWVGDDAAKGCLSSFGAGIGDDVTLLKREVSLVNPDGGALGP